MLTPTAISCNRGYLTPLAARSVEHSGLRADHLNLGPPELAIAAPLERVATQHEGSRRSIDR